ncbi:hypothetical protein NC652_012066 [Populus alba x Populus x berolinensis]|uniref:Uncharacterized protein n=1 Tax=Populus alba x Populus x berolinensis TaxID=444605 RepID=A0AAD6W7S7_9ROSI|nr:hypothetical protein NC652_012066 [Populus alba x Populus x berolinensis]KAJ7001971.1 hypothetical protein NC653_012140 [Populus alba x Populus x berolinensis]
MIHATKYFSSLPSCLKRRPTEGFLLLKQLNSRLQILLKVKKNHPI